MPSRTLHPRHLHRHVLRLMVMLVVGAAVAASTWSVAGFEVALVLGWGAAALVYVVWVWLVIGRMGADDTRAQAVREDPARGVTDLLVLGASVASLAAVALLLVDSRSASDARAGWLAAVALLSVALSWLLIHTLFTLRYASRYHGGEPGGIDFNTTTKQPRYVDFAYVSFSLGMTFQISDTNLTTTGLRALALRHALLSYVFGTIVVATTINLAISLSG